MKKQIITFVVSIAMLLAIGANAASITNGGFELGANANVATNWADIEVSTNDVYYVPSDDASRYPDPWSRTLTIKGYSGTTGSQQILNTVQSSYTFNFDAGFRNDGVAGSADLVVSIWDTVAGAALASETITVSASGIVAQSDPTWGNWQNYTVTLNIDTTGVSEVSLRFANNSGGTWENSAMVDNVIDPDTATLVLPTPNGVDGVDIGTMLEWVAPIAYTATGYDVYFGTNPDVASNPKVVDNQLVTTYAPPADLEWETTYYWAVNSYDGAIKYEGTTWTFVTRPEFLPTVPLKKGPYLIYTGANTEMQVLWQVNTTQSNTIEWGLDTTYSLGSAGTTEYGSDHQHSYTISGLASGTKYYYSVYADADYYTGSFTTAPANNATDVKFFAYGDTRSVPSNQETVAGQIIDTYTIDPDFQTLILHVADWVNADGESYWTNEFFPTSYDNLVQFKKDIPINGCRGNHEGGGSVYNKYYPYPYVSGFYWSFDYGPAHIVVLDQYTSYTSGSAQHTWLVNDLVNTTKQWKFIVLHEPGWSAGGHANNTTVQSVIQPLCLEYGVDVVFCGHNHYYARCDVDGVQHVTTGGGGAPLYAPNQNAENLVIAVQVHQHTEITITGDQLDFLARKNDGSVIDTFTISHALDITAPTPDPMTFATAPYATGTTSINMTATTASDASGVEYYFTCTAGGGNDSGWQSSVTYEDTGLAPSTQYTYTVTAHDLSTNQNTTAASSGASATTDAAPILPAAPSSLSAAAVATTQIDLSWTDNASDETGFKIERSKRVNTSFVQIVTVGQDVTSYSDTTVAKGTTYYYRIRATNTNGDSAYSNEANATTPRK